MSKAQKARDIIERFPHLSKHKLAELLLKENSLLFKDKEDARNFVRHVTGSAGKIMVKQTDKYKGVLPQGEKNDFSPFVLKGKRIGIISDVHIPYHDLDALKVALNEFKRVKVDTIVLNGDIIDCYNLSRWEKDPNKRNHAYEMELLTIFLDDLIKMFPKAELVFKLGNHSERYEKFVYSKSPEFIGFHVLSWKHDLRLLFKLGVMWRERQAVRGSEPLPHEALAMRGIASMPEALLRVRQWHITFGYRTLKRFKTAISRIYGLK